MPSYPAKTCGVLDTSLKFMSFGAITCIKKPLVFPRNLLRTGSLAGAL